MIGAVSRIADPIPVVLVCVLLAAAAGCSGSGANKAGRSSEKTVHLTLAEQEFGQLDIALWAREVERASGGTIQIEDRPRSRENERFDRARIDDVRSGVFDIAKVPARSWDEVGVTRFRALLAPLLIDSYQLEQRVLASDLPEKMLPAVQKQHLVGLAVLPGLLRKPLGVKRFLLRPHDFAGATIGMRAGGVPWMTFDDLRSKPVVYVPGDAGQVAALDGVESDVNVINSGGYDRGARALTVNVNLWPRVLTLVMNRRKFDSLSDRQKTALRSAESHVLGRQIADIVSLQRQKMHVLHCARRLQFVQAKASDLEALSRAVRPVYAQLERDAATRRFIAKISAMKHSSEVDGRPVDCDRASSGQAAASPIDGVYHSKVTRAELLRNPKVETGEDVPGNYGSFTLKIAKGQFEWTGAADGITEGGSLTVDPINHRVTIRPDRPSDVADEQYVYRYSVYPYRGLLSFRKVTGGPTLLVVHPWRRQ
jgi:TRAP-type C4-dicarboxylate transport system substrate-binding protein